MEGIFVTRRARMVFSGVWGDLILSHAKGRIYPLHPLHPLPLSFKPLILLGSIPSILATLSPPFFTLSPPSPPSKRKGFKGR